MKRIALSLSSLFLPLFAQAAAPLLPADYRQKTFTVENPLVLDYLIDGDPSNKLSLHVVNYPGMKSDLFFFHMHMDEVTAKKAGEDSVRANGGTFMYLTHATGKRDAVVHIDKVPYRFDPNRIFTAKGLEEKTVPPPQGKALQDFRGFVTWVKTNISLGRGQRARPMVTALHNNTDDDVHGEVLSILTEQKLIGIDNRAVNINRAWDIDNFYIATMKSTYDALVSAFNPNISLRMEKPRDIGYLSNWMITEGIEYVNVETEHEDVEGNMRMIEIIQTLFH